MLAERKTKSSMVIMVDNAFLCEFQVLDIFFDTVGMDEVVPMFP